VDILSLFFTRRTRPGQPTRPSRTRRASSSIEQEGEEDAHAATHTDLADQRELRLVRGSGPVAPHRHFPLHAVEDGLVHDVVHDVMDDVMLDEVVVTDTIPLREEAKRCKRIRQLSIAALLAETMLRISNEDSVSSLFME